MSKSKYDPQYDPDTYDDRVKALLPKARKLSRTQLKAFTRKMAQDQGNVCPLCDGALSFDVGGFKSNVVAEHDHVTGLIKSALCRGCNGASGKVQRAVASWGKVGVNNIAAQARYLHKVADQLMKTSYPAIYPDHNTVEEKLALADAKKLRIKQEKARQAARFTLRAKQPTPKE